MKFLSILTLTLVSFTFTSNSSTELKVTSSDSIVKLVEQFPDSGTIVINFWATWCGPCVHEMPYFVKAEKELANKNVSFYFVSFDQTSNKAKVQKYINKNKIPGQHALIQVSNMNSFINQISPKWQGGIPYTVVLKPQGRQNQEGSFDSYDDLIKFIDF
jgi:thiol-disulfide isomerase/thioredoxin